MQRWLRVLFQNLSVFILILLWISEVQAVPAMGMGYEPKYPADFKHFDYVSTDAEKGGEITLYGLGTFDSLNPYLLKGLSAEGLGTLVFESLLEKSLDEPFSMYGLIADDFYLAEDRLSVTFHINPAARFSNGKRITAEDVKFSFDTLMSKAAHSPIPREYTSESSRMGFWSLRKPFRTRTAARLTRLRLACHRSSPRKCTQSWSSNRWVNSRSLGLPFTDGGRAKCSFSLLPGGTSNSTKWRGA